MCPAVPSAVVTVIIVEVGRLFVCNVICIVVAVFLGVIIRGNEARAVPVAVVSTVQVVKLVVRIRIVRFAPFWYRTVNFLLHYNVLRRRGS
jgi:hypothetical protein